MLQTARWRLPVCPTSDVFYQILKGTINNIVGNDNIIEYGPLIARVSLRLRLELCVLESFLYEAIIPFIQKKGLTWVLPIHETLETFVAGTFFALATNFILLGSSKIFNIILVYIDALTGFPARNLGKLKNTKTFNKIPLNYFWMLCSGYGQLIGIIKNVTTGYDKFVGDYLVIITSIYITFKFIHYRFF